jgi:hypothetical protein
MCLGQLLQIPAEDIPQVMLAIQCVSGFEVGQGPVYMCSFHSVAVEGVRDTWLNMWGVQHTPCLRGVQHTPCLRGVQHTPHLRGVQHTPCLRGVQHTPCLRGVQHTPHLEVDICKVVGL